MHPVESLSRLFAVPDLELAPRSQGLRQTANHIPGFSDVPATIEGRTEGLREGYAPIPCLEEAGHNANISPLAVSRSWMHDIGLDLEALCVLTVLPGHIAPGLTIGDRAIIDRRPDPEFDGRLFVFFDYLTGAARIARLERLNPKTVISTNAAPGLPRISELHPAARIVGPVVGLMRRGRLYPTSRPL